DARLNATGPRLTDGTHAAAPAKLLGTHRAPLGGLAPTNRFLLVHVVFFCELRQGRLFRVRAFLAAYVAAVQPGLLPHRHPVSGPPAAHARAVAPASARSAFRCSGGSIDACALPTHPAPPESRTPCITRRSGRRVSVRTRCSSIAAPRTSRVLQPPPFAAIRS